ncbi:Protein of unknown function [Paramicrobacterium humi]|uniref:DUF3180 domain-containing protein n=1 Tax=Paramicrobacterium humi TaxID=640635 RepID=A0A1H4MR94_9MICO|nr:DUF3180 domain-containing protein [Microbacterium humi]SEB85055.1 Protein of unknown function [Microbacterium humi]
MSRTRPTSLLVLGAIGILVGYLLELAMVANGRPMIVPELTLPITLVIVGGVVLGFAIPIRRSVTGKSQKRIDPFAATRVVSLAKASSFAGAVFLGAGIGMLGFMLSRTVLPGVASVWLAGAMAAGAVLLMAAGLVAEHLCRLPKDDDDDDPDASDA